MNDKMTGTKSLNSNRAQQNSPPPLPIQLCTDNNPSRIVQARRGGACTGGHGRVPVAYLFFHFNRMCANDL